MTTAAAYLRLALAAMEAEAPPAPVAPPADTRLLLTASEVARRLSVSDQTVYRMMQRGELGSRRIGRAVRVPVAALAAWMRQGETRRGLRRVS